MGTGTRGARTMLTDPARWGSCGIPSIWRSPTARRSGGSPQCDQQRPRVALPPCRRVVALGGGRRDVTPCLPGPGPRLWPAIPEICPPGEGMFCLDRAAVADVARLGEC